MKIGELAEQSGLAPSAIRFYEQSGLLPAPERGANGYRVYADTALKRLRLIQLAQNLGFSLDSLRCVFAGGDSFSKPDLLARLDGRVREIDELIAGLRTQQHNLKAVRATLNDSWEPGECVDPDTLAEGMETPRNKALQATSPPRKTSASVHKIQRPSRRRV